MDKISRGLERHDSNRNRAKRARLREQLATLYLECVKLEGRLNHIADAKQKAKEGIEKFPRFAELRLGDSPIFAFAIGIGLLPTSS